MPSTPASAPGARAPRSAACHSCATLAGGVVVNRDLDELGNIRHLMIDVATGRIEYALLASGGVFGIGERLFVIPWKALSLGAEGGLVLDVAKDALDASFLEQK